MRQILQNLRSGVTELAEVPCPRAGAGQVLIRTSRSLVSAGTERMLVEFGKAGWIAKARQQPDKVRQVLDKGQQACVRAFVAAMEQGGPSPIPIEELMEVTRVTLEVAGRHEGRVGLG